MQFTPRNVRKFLQGGEMAPADATMAPEQMPEELAPAGGAEQDPLMMLVQAAAQALQSLDCLLAMLVCLGLIALVQLMSGGAQPKQLGEPVFKKGGKLLRRIKK